MRPSTNAHSVHSGRLFCATTLSGLIAKRAAVYVRSDQTELVHLVGARRSHLYRHVSFLTTGVDLVRFSAQPHRTALAITFATLQACLWDGESALIFTGTS